MAARRQRDPRHPSFLLFSLFPHTLNASTVGSMVAVVPSRQSRRQGTLACAWASASHGDVTRRGQRHACMLDKDGHEKYLATGTMASWPINRPGRRCSRLTLSTTSSAEGGNTSSPLPLALSPPLSPFLPLFPNLGVRRCHESRPLCSPSSLCL